MKTSKWVALVLAAVMALSLCVPALAEETIKIGGIGPLTGGAAMYGIPIRNGAQLYIDQLNEAGGINGAKVEFVWEDDAGKNEQAQKLYYDFYDDGFAAILGPVLTDQCNVVGMLADEDGIPMVTPSGTAFDITSGKNYVYRSCFIDEFQGYVMANYAAEIGYKNVAILYGADSAYSMGLVAAFEAQAAAKELNIVAKEAANFTDIDFKAQLTNIKNAAPDAVFLPYYGDAMALILPQAKEVGLETIYLGADGTANVVENIADKSLLTSVVYSDHFAFDSDDESVVNFVNSYTEKYGEKPEISFAATGYDAALVICEAIKVAGTTDHDALNEAIKNITVEGVSGIISFDENNNPVKSAFIMGFDAEGNKHFEDRVDPE